MEDEAIIAMEIESSLQNLGYEVSSVVNSGDDVIKSVKKDRPDLILMDIRIQGDKDGIDTAEIVRNQFGIPVVFSTAYLDEERIERAKITMPFGYVLKPIQERDLKVTLEMALYVAKADVERKNTENALIESEKRLKNSQRLAQIGDWDWDLETEEITWSDEMYQIHGVDKESFHPTYESVTKLFHPDDVEKLAGEELHKQSPETPVFETESRIIDQKTGNIKWIHICQETIRDPDYNPVRVKGTIQDITKQKEIEEAQRKSLNLLQIAEDVGKAGCWSQDLQTQQEQWSMGEYRIHGLNRDDIINPTYDLHLQCIHPEDREKHDSLFKEHLASKEINCSQTYRILTKNGIIKYIQANYQILRDKDGHPISIWGMDKDITEQKRADEAIKETREDLNRKNALLTSLINSPPEVIVYSLDKDYCYTYFNKAHFNEIKSISGAEIEIGMSVFANLSDEEGVAAAKANYDRVFQGEQFSAVESFGEPGSKIWYESYYNPIFDAEKRLIGVSVFAINIADRKKGEVASAVSAAKTRKSR